MITNPTALGAPTSVASSSAELARANQSLLTRERLLAASAQASRLLLEAPDVMQGMSAVLRLLGEAADVDRTTFALAEINGDKEHWLVLKSEWLADRAAGQAYGKTANDSRFACFCPQLHAGKSVIVTRDDSDGSRVISIASEHARSSAIVPIMVDGEYAGAIGFDDRRREREFDAAIISALEIAAGFVGAALHRERLLETVRRTHERAAEERVAQLARANATLRSNLEQLASNPDLRSFMGHMLLEATRQLEAAAGIVAMHDETADQWRVVAHVEEGRITEPRFAMTVPTSAVQIDDILDRAREPIVVDLVAPCDDSQWPGASQWHRDKGHQSACKVSLVFGDRNVGFIAVAFTRREHLSPERAEILMALAQQATLAIGMKRLGYAAKNAAVLAERNRIGQEIHDGLAQGFTGILMQLGAAEEFMECGAPDSRLSVVLRRIRDLAKEGLAEARRSVLALRPAQTRIGGLELALRQLAERSSIPGGVTCTFEGGMAGNGLAPEKQHELLRIAQEAVTNAMRHAHAKTVRIALIEAPEHLLLTVSDDGLGMEELEINVQQGFGLANMRERANAIGGKWQIHSRPGEGTQVIVWLPRA